MAEAAKNEFEKSKWKHIPEGPKSRCLQKSTKRMRTPRVRDRNRTAETHAEE